MQRVIFSSVVVLFFLIFLNACNKPREIETAKPYSGEIRESFSEPAKTRLAKTWPITMPIDGRIERIELEPGDAVKAQQELVKFDALSLNQSVVEARASVKEFEENIKVQENEALENTAKIDALQSIKAAQESLKAAAAQVEAEQKRSVRANKELVRIEKLFNERAVPEGSLDDARLHAETSLIELRKQEFYLTAFRFVLVAIKLGPQAIDDWLGRKAMQKQVYVQQLAQAQARLARAEHDLRLARIHSPIEGVVLERFEQGDSTLSAGQRLLLLGSLDELEVIADVLTQDAMRLQPGSRVILKPASRLEPLEGRVKKIEPAGFTKLSSLGVEQQRVNVIVWIAKRPKNLGVGYRVQARFITGEKKQALIVPRTAVMQAPDGSYYVFKVTGGTLSKAVVEIGLRSDLELEITRGLSEADAIVAVPDTTLKEGEAVEAVSE